MSLLVLTLAGCNEAAAPPDRLVEGQPFPAVMFTGLNGATVPLATYRGKLVVLNVWATWCPPCRKELPSLQRLSLALDPQRYAVLGLSLDEDVHIAREFLLDKGISFPIFIDQDMRIADGILGLRVLPDTLFIAPDGTYLGRIAGKLEWDAPAVVDALDEAYQGRHQALGQLGGRH